MKDKIRKLERKYQKLKSENKALWAYLQHLTNPVRQEDQSLVSPTALSKESMDSIERMRKVTQGTEK